MSESTKKISRKPGNSVNHPPHYNTGRIEVIDAIEDWKLGFHLGNAVKYIARAPHKGGSLRSEIEDLSKAVWYIQRRIELLKDEDDEDEDGPSYGSEEHDEIMREIGH